MSEPPFDVKRAHRWFAVEFNNLSWDLVSAKERTPDQTERMIHAAHAACIHWLEVGNLLNHQRAQCLLASAYAVAGLADSAMRHAERCLALSLEAGDTQTAFDRATAHGCASAAFRVAGRNKDAVAHYAIARAAAEKFDDAGDRTVFESLYPAP